MIITKASHPALYKAFGMITSDTGGRPLGPQYEIPEGWEERVTMAEAGLSTLSHIEMEELAGGEEDASDRIAAGSQDLMVANRVLEAFFDEWPR